MKQTRLNCHQGLTLLEVIVSIAILGAAMALIANVIYVGSRSAGRVRWSSEAQLLGDSKMAELSAGIVPLQSAGLSVLPENPRWSWSVDVGAAQINGLLMATVTVQPTDGGADPRQRFTLTRWLPDPNYTPEKSMLQ
jgi:general secretion pathway protein I